VRRELAIAGIPARSDHVRRPRANRVKVTDRRLVELYVKEGHNVVETAAILEVSTEYVRKRLHEAGLIKRPGTFTPHVPWEPDQLRLRAAVLYQAGMVHEGGRGGAGRECGDGASGPARGRNTSAPRWLHISVRTGARYEQPSWVMSTFVDFLPPGRLNS
jgi:hypothetical protein